MAYTIVKCLNFVFLQFRTSFLNLGARRDTVTAPEPVASVAFGPVVYVCMLQVLGWVEPTCHSSTNWEHLASAPECI